MWLEVTISSRRAVWSATAPKISLDAALAAPTEATTELNTVPSAIAPCVPLDTLLRMCANAVSAS
ncbi:MAG: hypothetical protein DDT39_01518 [Firmicutes bacterium]|nr:hypothetical protein [candidate division NPL-UPA2 bacterium]